MKYIETSWVAGATVLVCGLALAGEPAVRIETGATHIEVTALGWDTEGTGRETTNLLRPQTMVNGRVPGTVASDATTRLFMGER